MLHFLTKIKKQTIKNCIRIRSSSPANNENKKSLIHIENTHNSMKLIIIQIKITKKGNINDA